MALSENIAGLVHRIYDGAWDVSRYLGIAADISGAIGTHGATLVMHTTDTQRIVAADLVHYDHLAVDDIFAEYGGYWHERNPQVLFERANPMGTLYFEGCDPHFNSGTYPEFRSWCEATLGIRSQLTGYCRPSDDLTYAFAFSSHDGRHPASREQIELLAYLMGHLRQSVGLAYRLGTLEQRCAELLHHLETASGPVLLIDAWGRPLFVNDAMTQFLHETFVLTLGVKGLTARSGRIDDRLQRLLANAIGPQASGGALLVPAGDDRPGFVLQVAPLSGAPDAFGIDRAAAIVTVANHRQPSACAAATFRAALALTVTEANVAVFLMTGRPDEEIARAMGIAVSTVRSHVRAVLEKTHLHSKAELAHLLTLIAR